MAREDSVMTRRNISACLPDPVDSAAERNNFWDVATGREADVGVSLALPVDSLFIYGEVLQDKNVKEREYTEYMDVTASAYGHALRNALKSRAIIYADSLDFMASYCRP